ncbi:glutaredoxin 3 [Vibrio metoecus]|uniref:Glutaredoxin n=1 Tax=Vibrio metoecus TaxID=1481663 RepID=A0A067BHU3_VIBMT|nr:MULTISPECIES: glutaredoxin 3 [Vibrio]EEX64475.1 glutaredoxin 3 [Vibrio metoecus]KDO14352.1 glutaredoxin [Vibrio metoecus]KQA16082.1 glutaredoxin [Vibrio metoecus]KQA27217.1 glutaredoxin [Vibrio metoecus]KQA99011.1 glutaredoxin [Vibrio metoecus]
MLKIEIYTKSYCPYCKAAKQTLTSMGLSYHEIEVSDSQILLREMVNRSLRRTVPQIFVGDIHIGGHDDLMAAIKNGQFKQVLTQQVNAQ